MRKTKILMAVLVLSLLAMPGCDSSKSDRPKEDGKTQITNTAEANADEANTLTYEQISASEAKAIMDSGVEYVIIDARTQEEFAQGHIEGAIMIPEYEIAEKAEEKIPDKDTLILVYCRSGRRSKIAADGLVKLRYTNVKEFGGIIDWPYGIVTE